MAKRILIVPLALFFAMVLYAQGKSVFADHVQNSIARVAWKNTTEYVERDFGIKIPFNTSRWSVHCAYHQSDGARLNLRNILQENSSMPVCYAEDMRSGYAHIALYTEHTRALKKGKDWQKNIVTPFLAKLGKDALLDIKQYVSLYMQQFVINKESTRINSEETISCGNTKHDVELRRYVLLAETNGVMNVSDVSFSISHAMHVIFVSFLIPNTDIYMTLVVYNKGVSHDITDDACALAKQMTS